MRSLGPSGGARPARRLSAVALALVVSTTLLSAVVGPGASADDAAPVRQGAAPTAPPVSAPVTAPAAGSPAARTRPAATSQRPTSSGPDFPRMPADCFTTDPYALTPKPCRLTPRIKGAPLLVLWGDSHAWMMTPAVRKAVARKRVNVVTLMQGACPVMYSALDTAAQRRASNGCDEFGHQAVAFLRNATRFERPVRVVVAMAWELYHNVTDPPNGADRKYPGFVNDYIRVNAAKSLQGTPRAFRALARMRIRTDIVAAQPMVYQTAPDCPGAGQGWLCPLPRAGVLKDAKENNARIREMRSLLSLPGSIIRPAQSLCDATTCQGTIDGVPTWYDRIHLGQRASYRLSSHFQPTVSALLREARAQRRSAR